MDGVIQVIQTLGFPVATAVALGWYFVKTDNRLKDEAAKREEKSSSQIDSLTKSLTEVAAILKEVTETNKDLTETNRLLAIEVKAGIDKILEKVSEPKG